ncbi:MAG: DNA translocase FtsK 4TM domain-containing protein [Verrucomicrobia bacterium]|nr:DNA translocase FtsK 4TM domain-containing protein [Verrucomicrobiota bacterium]MDA1045591.1 DNA translocase FtsK 4TM domain-containing protein [Verrucomicrobiota bacterium]
MIKKGIGSGAPKASVGKITPVRRPWLAAGLAVAALVCLVSLLDYDGQGHADPSVGEPHLLGGVGEFLSDQMLASLGLGAWLLPWAFGCASFLTFAESTKSMRIRKLTTIGLVIISISTLANLRDAGFRAEGGEPLLDKDLYRHGAGGSLGGVLYSGVPLHAPPEVRSGGFLGQWLGGLGTGLLMSITLGGCLLLHWSVKPNLAFVGLQGWTRGLRERLSVGAKNLSGSEEAPSPKQKKEKTQSVGEPDATVAQKKNSIFSRKKEEDDILFGKVGSESDAVEATPSTPKIKKKSLPEEQDLSAEEENAPPVPELKKALKPVPGEVLEAAEDKSVDGFRIVRAAKTEKAANLFPERKGDYHFPTLDLLMDPPEEEDSADEDHMIKAVRLRDTLAQFKIEVELGEVHTGPVITRYDIHPAAGIKVAKIANLEKDLAMALKAESVRIIAPVPGKGCVGIEVPNDKPAAVCLKEILESKAWADANAEIPIVLGKDASGIPLVADLTKMPHLLVAGTTGSGKTVCINTIIASLCYHSSPEDVRFIMVDPKIVEMKVYNDLPHMLIPVVTEPKKVPGALKWLLIEMERRYQIFSKVGARNIAGFNAKILKDKKEKEKAIALEAEMTPEERAALSSIEVPRDDSVLEIPENKLPYIVCFIDELADLMMVAQADVETGIARLAQLARAAGIHLIIATQRPSVNVITGVIKANLPSRISFRVASYRDSQTILDSKGAETLIGRGDMLFIPPGSPVFIRAQGAFVSDDEINGIVEYLKRNGPPEIIEEVRAQVEAAGQEEILGEDGDSDEDPMVKRAIEIIRTTKRASTSNLQRKLSIGYNRAARIMDELEDRGMVGPDYGSQGREILLDL